MHEDDRRRLAAVRGSGLMVGVADPTFDRAARTVARCTGAPVALVSIVGAARQHFVGQSGLDGVLADRRGTAISSSRCRFVVDADAALVVDDAAEHADLGLLPPMGDLPVGAYAGVPLHDPDGMTLGAVCAIDHAPRTWADADVTALEDVAAFLQAHLTLRTTTRELRGLAVAPPASHVRPRRRRGAGRCSSLPVPPRRS